MSNKNRGVTRAALIKITTAAVLTALSAVFALTVRFPLFTAFYEMEFSDFPLLVCTFLWLCLCAFILIGSGNLSDLLTLYLLFYFDMEQHADRVF